MKLSEAFDDYRDSYMILKGRSRSTIEHHEYKKESIVKFLNDKPIEKVRTSDMFMVQIFIENQVSEYREELHFDDKRSIGLHES